MCSNMARAADLSWQSFPRLRKRSPMPRLIRMAIGSVCDGVPLKTSGAPWNKDMFVFGSRNLTS